jgi:hypothetical protein
VPPEPPVPPEPVVPPLPVETVPPEPVAPLPPLPLCWVPLEEQAVRRVAERRTKLRRDIRSMYTSDARRGSAACRRRG